MKEGVENFIVYGRYVIFTCIKNSAKLDKVAELFGIFAIGGRIIKKIRNFHFVNSLTK